MDKIEEFREFAKTKPFLKDLVENGTYTWQDLFERYDIYGEDDELFKSPEEKNEKNEQGEQEKKEGFGSLLNAISGFDATKIQEGLSGMKKILGILGEVTKPDEKIKTTRRKVTRPYQRNDD